MVHTLPHYHVLQKDRELLRHVMALENNASEEPFIT